MTFKSAVENTPGLEGEWRAGLQSLSGADREHIGAEDTRQLRGSVNLDAALKNSHRDDPRWDYAVGHKPINRSGEVVYWIEIHPAGSAHVGAVLAKLAWLKHWLGRSAADLNALPKVFLWVSSGRTSFTARAPQVRRLAQAGLRHAGRFFSIPNVFP